VSDRGPVMRGQIEGGDRRLGDTAGVTGTSASWRVMPCAVGAMSARARAGRGRASTDADWGWRFEDEGRAVGRAGLRRWAR